MEYIILGICLVVTVTAVSVVKWRNRQERILLNKLEDMIEAARAGEFRSSNIDETMLSSVENSMSRFLEDNYVAGEKVKSQKEMIQTLISDISHQTVTPISNILLYSQLIGEHIQDEFLAKEVTAVSEQAEKLSFLIESLVKTSRLETGIIQTTSTDGNPFQVLENAAGQVSEKAREKNIKIIIEPVNQTVHACFDAKWTTEAICNILDNAIKYTGENGKVTGRIKQYTMFCRIDIIDNGVGMEETEIPKIFGRFYRSERTNQEEGVGLGLYLAREIIRQESGYIKASSLVGEGSMFSIFLPVEG